MKFKFDNTAFMRGFSQAFLIFGDSRLDQPLVQGQISERVDRNFMRMSIRVRKAARMVADEQTTKAR